MQDAWLRLERHRNGLGPDDVRISLFTNTFPPESVDPAAAAAAFHQISLTTFADGEMTRDVILQFIREPGFSAAGAGLSIKVDAQTVGEHLYTRFVSGPVLTAFEALVEAAAKADVGVRLWIEILEPQSARPDETRQLSDLPWEALAAPRRLADFLAMRPGWTIVRAARNPQVQPTADRSLRILVLTGQDELVPAAGQRAAVLAAEDAALVVRPFQLSDWSTHVEVSKPPGVARLLRTTLEDLRAHVIHFIGHGGISNANNHALVFRGGGASAWTWEVNDVPIVLNQSKVVPRLAVVNACYEAGALGQSTSLAQAFLDAGAAAAIGMQARVQAKYALLFSRGFYAAIAAGDAPDVALSKARDAIREGDDVQNGASPLARDWILPVLTLALPPDQVLPRAEYLEEIKACDLRRRILDQGPFVDRHERRRNLLVELMPWSGARPGCHGALVWGANDSGKSWFVQRCLPELAQAGAIVRYCDLTAVKGASSSEVIARLREGWKAMQSFAYAPLPDAPFAAYDAARADLQPMLDASGNNRLADSQLARLFQAFRAGLAELAKTRCVVLVFDEFSKSGGGRFDDTEYKTCLYPYLIEPILKGELGAVYVVLALREGDMEMYGLKKTELDRIPPGLKPFQMELFEMGDAESLFLEYCRFRRDQTTSIGFQMLMDLLKRRRLTQWQPSILAMFRAFLSDGGTQGGVRP